MTDSSTPLSAINFLGLIKQRKVARIDLVALGYEGVIYIRDITAAEQARVTSSSGKSGKARYFPSDKSYEMDLTALVEASGPRFLATAAVTDAEGGLMLERAFAAAGEDAEWVRVAESDLVQMSDTWIKEAGNRQKMEQMLEGTPNAIMNEVVKTVKRLSGMADDADRVEEKKETS